VSTRTVILARHGETELNRLGSVQGSGVDPALNGVGQAQARALYEHLDGKIDFVVSSGMVRANETAQRFLDAGIRSGMEEDFREICWGSHEGKVATDALRKEYQSLITRWEEGHLDACIGGGGESAQQLGDRVWQGWQRLVGKDFSTALVVMHGRALRALVCLLDKQSLSAMNAYAHGNAAYYRVVEKAGVWELENHLITEHLDSLQAQETSGS